ncbi:uncharacterized [Lates japonicus]
MDTENTCASLLSSGRHMLASVESNNSSSNLPGIDSTRSSFRETSCGVISSSSNHRTLAERTAAASLP